MRALASMLLALVVALSTLSASATALWPKRNHPQTATTALPQAGDQVPFDTLAQARPMTPGAVPQSASGSSQMHLKGPGPHKGDWLRKYFGMSPSQQEKSLEQDPVFKSLPPDKQEHLLNRLRSFNSLPPNKQQAILNRMETYEHLPPEKQAEARTLFQQYHGLPPDQKTQMSQAYHKLRNMTPEQRAQYMNSDEFRNSFDDQQRELLRGMNDLADSAVR
jgi:Protein of unknown function (DUF3106)